MSYRVQAGDTLSAIAHRHSTSVKAILSLNPSIRDASRLRIGQELSLPPQQAARTRASPGQRPTVDRSTHGAPGLLDQASAAAHTAASWMSEHWASLGRHLGLGGFRFDRKRFFDAFRREFGALAQNQVDALEALLKMFEGDADIPDQRTVAYMFATIKHETASTFEPIVERGPVSYFDRYDPVRGDTLIRRETAKSHGNTQEGDGYKYRGRGYVQLTWKNNYALFGRLTGHDLVNKPDEALQPELAFEIMSRGMRDGLFTGHKIGDYMGSTTAKPDYLNARKVINALDQAATIKGYAQQFERILTAASAT